jgi:hypothetical protein
MAALGRGILSRHWNAARHPIAENECGKRTNSNQSAVDNQEFPTNLPFARKDGGGEAKDGSRPETQQVTPTPEAN